MTHYISYITQIKQSHDISFMYLIIVNISAATCFSVTMIAVPDSYHISCDLLQIFQWCYSIMILVCITSTIILHYILIHIPCHSVTLSITLRFTCWVYFMVYWYMYLISYLLISSAKYQVDNPKCGMSLIFSHIACIKWSSQQLTNKCKLI